MKAFEIGAKKTLVFYLHGLRGHAYAQKNALQHMVRNLGVSVVSLELPGHGADSFDEHCMVPPFEQLVDDIRREVTLHSMDAEQVILMGYSFGASLMTLAAEALSSDPDFEPELVGLIGISTAFDVGHNVKPWQLYINRLIAPLSSFLYQNAPLLSQYLTIREMDIDLISPNAVIQDSIKNDPLVYKGRIPLYTSAQVYQCGLKAKEAVNGLLCQVLLLHSQDDSIALIPSKTDFDDHVLLRRFKNLRHNCIDGLDREAVVARKAITKFVADKL